MAIFFVSICTTYFSVSALAHPVKRVLYADTNSFISTFAFYYIVVVNACTNKSMLNVWFPLKLLKSKSPIAYFPDI